MEKNRVDVAIVSTKNEDVKRIERLCESFSYTFVHYEGLEPFIEEPPVCQLVIVNSVGTEFEKNLAEIPQAVKQSVAGVYVICLISKRLKPEEAVFLKKSGADAICLESEMFECSKIDFITSQVLKTGYLPIKHSDLVPDADLDFDLYHLMPQRGKFLRFGFKGSALSAEKIQKIEKDVGEIYIQREDVQGFVDYTKRCHDGSLGGLEAKARAQFLLLSSKYLGLIVSLTDKSSMPSFKEGQELLSECQKICSDLMFSLSGNARAWEIVDKSGIGSFGSLERAPAVAAYCALFGMILDFDEIERVMLAALLADLGMILLPVTVTEKIRKNQIDSLSQVEKDLYRQYPNKSLEIVLERKLSIDETMRTVMLGKNETVDGSGFPSGRSGDGIPLAAQLVSFSDSFDKRTQLQFGKKRTQFDEAKEELVKKEIEAEIKDRSRYTPIFILKLKDGLLTQDVAGS